MAGPNSYIRRIESVECQVRQLQDQLEEMKQMLSVQSQPQALAGSGVDPELSVSVPQPSVSSPSQVLAPDMRLPAVPPRLPVLQGDMYRPAKKRRTGFEVREEPISDFISKGLITMDYAVECFTTWVRLL